MTSLGAPNRGSPHTSPFPFRQGVAFRGGGEVSFWDYFRGNLRRRATHLLEGGSFFTNSHHVRRVGPVGFPPYQLPSSSSQSQPHHSPPSETCSQVPELRTVTSSPRQATSGGRHLDAALHLTTSFDARVRHGHGEPRWAVHEECEGISAGRTPCQGLVALRSTFQHHEIGEEVRVLLGVIDGATRVRCVLRAGERTSRFDYPSGACVPAIENGA